MSRTNEALTRLILALERCCFHLSHAAADREQPLVAWQRPSWFVFKLGNVENTAAVAPLGMFGGFFIPLESCLLWAGSGGKPRLRIVRVHERVWVSKKPEREGGGSRQQFGQSERTCSIALVAGRRAVQSARLIEPNSQGLPAFATPWQQQPPRATACMSWTATLAASSRRRASIVFNPLTFLTAAAAGAHTKNKCIHGSWKIYVNQTRRSWRQRAIEDYSWKEHLLLPGEAKRVGIGQGCALWIY